MPDERGPFLARRELDIWTRTELRDPCRVSIDGMFRGEDSEDANWAPVLGFEHTSADTVKVRVALKPSISPNRAAPHEFTRGATDCQCEAEADQGGSGSASEQGGISAGPSRGHLAASRKETDIWWNTWSPVFLAAGLVLPIVDPVTLLDLLHEDRRVRFFCDTNALAGGSVAWLMQVFQGRVDLVTSAVVEREFAAWLGRSKFWTAQTLKGWNLRTQFRLARQVLDTLEPGATLEHLAPEQSALILAKLRDETSRRSPDADMLLIELARELIRDQPRNARVVYLTGDRTNARMAASTLGARNVLSVVHDRDAASRCSGQVVGRGWWEPVEPLGRVVQASLAELLRTLLAPCASLRIRVEGGQSWIIRPANRRGQGVPSDWHDPLYEVKQMSPSPDTAPGGTAIGESNTTSSLSSDGAARGIPIPASDEPAPRSDATTARVGAPASDDAPRAERWLLPPQPVQAPLALPTRLRPQPRTFFDLLCRRLIRHDWPVQSTDQSLHQEVARLLCAFGVETEESEEGPRAEEWRRAWHENDLDWIHAELLRLPGYGEQVSRLGCEPPPEFSARQREQIAMARALGQVACLGPIASAVHRGDAPLTVRALVGALERWLPTAGDSIDVSVAARLATDELVLTPFRFERAMQLLWEQLPDLPIQGRTGGTVAARFEERVVHLEPQGYSFRRVGPGTLTFGRAGAVRFLERVR